MKFPIRIEQRGAEFFATSLGEPICTVKAPSRTQAIEKIRKEIRYRIELCPCTGVEDDFVEVVEV
jgi:hypothetical protein